jgi:hypothetical protein
VNPPSPASEGAPPLGHTRQGWAALAFAGVFALDAVASGHAAREEFLHTRAVAQRRYEDAQAQLEGLETQRQRLTRALALEDARWRVGLGRLAGATAHRLVGAEGGVGLLLGEPPGSTQASPPVEPTPTPLPDPWALVQDPRGEAQDYLRGEVVRLADERTAPLREDLRRAEAHARRLSSSLQALHERRQADLERFRLQSEDFLAQAQTPREGREALLRGLQDNTDARQGALARLHTAQVTPTSEAWGGYRAWLHAGSSLLGALMALVALARARQHAPAGGSLRIHPKKTGGLGDPVPQEILPQEIPPHITPDNRATLDLAPQQTLWVAPAFVRSALWGPTLWPPFAWSAPWARLWHGRYWLSRVEGRQAARVELEGPLAQGSFAQVALAEGERLVLDVSSLAGVVVEEGRGGAPLRAWFGGLARAAFWVWGHPIPCVVQGPARVWLYGERLRALGGEGKGAQEVGCEQVAGYDPDAGVEVRPLSPLTLAGVWLGALTWQSRARVPAGARAVVRGVLREQAWGNRLFHHYIKHTAWLAALTWAVARWLGRA